MANIKCIDVSEWQGSVNFAQIKKSGIDYVILRAGFGREASQVDSEFENNYKKAKTAGLKIGAYWYSYADSVDDAKREAQACLKVLKGKSFELPVFYDMEDGSQSRFAESTLTAIAEAFCEAIKAGGFVPGVYANLYWFTNRLDYNKLESKYFIWLAQYNSEAQLGCDIWQYSSSGKVAGVTGNVDMNIIYNDAVIKGNEVVKAETKNYEAALCQSLMMIANRLGFIAQTIPSITNKYDTQTDKAVKQMKKFLGLAAESSKVDTVFVSKTYSAIIDALGVLRSDVNGDGEVNIKDATALQKRLAGIE